MPANIPRQHKAWANGRNKAIHSSELQEFKVCLTHHVNPIRKICSETAAFSPVQHPDSLQHPLRMTGTITCSHIVKRDTAMTRPEITVSMPYLVSSLQVLEGNKEEPSKGRCQLWQLQNANTAHKPSMLATLSICFIYLGSGICRLVSLQLAFGDPKAEGNGSSQHQLNGDGICHTAWRERWPSPLQTDRRHSTGRSPHMLALGLSALSGDLARWWVSPGEEAAGRAQTSTHENEVKEEKGHYTHWGDCTAQR